MRAGRVRTAFSNAWLACMVGRPVKRVCGVLVALDHFSHQVTQIAIKVDTIDAPALVALLCQISPENIQTLAIAMLLPSPMFILGYRYSC
jgi:hypothetical protein